MEHMTLIWMDLMEAIKMECDGCKWEHWMPESSNEPWCPFDICEDGDQFEKGVNHDGKA